MTIAFPETNFVQKLNVDDRYMCVGWSGRSRIRAAVQEQEWYEQPLENKNEHKPRT